MLTSAGYPPDSVGSLQVNTLADGLFHAGTWIVTLIGVIMLWRAGRSDSVPFSGKVLGGAMLAGFGLFKVVEGLVDHCHRLARPARGAARVGGTAPVSVGLCFRTVAILEP